MTALVRLYPRAWRDRYEAEFLGILEARPPSGRDRLDILRGALDARLHPEVPGSPAAPRRSIQLTRFVGIAAVVGGLAWVAWVALILGDVRWLASGASDNASLLAVAAAVGYLSLAVVHAGLALLDAGRSSRQVFAAVAASIAVAFFILSGFGVWWTPVFALPASVVFAVAIAGRLLTPSLTVAWAATAFLTLGVFLGVIGDAFGALSSLVGAVPFGLFWITIGAMLAMRGLPARATLPDGSG